MEAPHKPVMLLAVIRGIRKKEITDHRIFITPELLLNFRETWRQLVDTGHIENFALPFFPLYKLEAFSLNLQNSPENSKFINS